MRFIDFFAGTGGIRRGLEMAGHKCVGFCEYDKFATAAYTSMHLLTDEQRSYLATLSQRQIQHEVLNEEYRNGEWYASDIRNVRADELPRADMWCFGAPCFVSGAMVTTHRGRIPIEDVCVGDLVLTHQHRFKPVTQKMINYKDDIYTLRVQGSLKVDVTGNHPFYVRYGKRVWNNSRRNYDWAWSTPEWKAVEDFNGDEYFLFPSNMNSSNAMNLTDQECWLIGRYVADGYINEYDRKDRNTKIRRVVFCIGNNKTDNFDAKIDGYSFCMDTSAVSCTKYITTHKRLFYLCKECGHLAHEKHIPQFILDLPKDKLKIFLNGYLSGDGSEYNEIYAASTVSKELVLQLGECVYKVYGTPFSISTTQPPPTKNIDGRIVNQRTQYTIRFRKVIKKQNKGRVIDGELWMPLKECIKHSRRKEIVYNLEVEDDHSYTVFGLAAHNCQSFSVAGKRAGLDGESGLIREIFRLLGETREEDRPEWLLYENVKGMFSSNKGLDFLAILVEMGDAGYDIEWQLLNSKYFGVPQNRERVFTIGHLRRMGSAKVLPVAEPDEKDRIPEVGIVAHRARYRRNTQTFSPEGITEALDTAQGGGRGHHVLVPLGVIDPQGRLKKECPINDISPTIRAQTHGNLPEVVIPVLTPDREKKRQNGRRFKENGEPAFTLTAQDRHGVAIGINISENNTRTWDAILINGNPDDHDDITVDLGEGCVVSAIWFERYQCYVAIRKLTPKECYRLQGWTDDYFEKAAFVLSDSQLYKTAGNGVTVTVVYEIGKALREIG